MDPQIKQLQIEMKKLGLYDGPIDGVEGAGTKAAIKLYEQKKRDDLAAERDAQLRQGQAETERAKAEAARAETERLRLKDEEEAKRLAEAESPYEQGRQIALFGAPAAAGLYKGYKVGNALSEVLRKRAAERAGNIGDLANSVRTGELSQTAARSTAARLRLLGKTKHSIGPMALGAGFAAIGGAQRALAPELTDNPIGQDVIRGFGGLESGLGTGLLTQQIFSAAGGLTQPSARDIATIDEPPPAPPAPPETPPKAAPKPGTRAALYAEAKARDLPVTTRTTKAELEKVMAKALKANATAAKRLRSVADKTSKNLVPLAVGYGVYDALRSPAEAADGSAAEPMSMAGAGAAAAGAGAGTAAGISKLRQVIGKIPGATAAMGQANAALAPIGIDAMTDYAPEDVNMARNFAARNLPDFMQFGAVKEAADMSQVPERNPLRTEASPGNQYYPLSSQQPEAEPQLEPLMAMADEDPEIANLLRELIMARSGNDQPATPMTAVASRLRSLGR